MASSSLSSSLPRSRWRSRRSAPAAAALLAALAGPCAAQTEAWFGGDAGLSAVRQSFTGGSRSSSEFGLNFRAGWVLSPQWRVGAELGGVLLEAADVNDPSRGRGISQAFIVGVYRLHDAPDSAWLKFGLGRASYWGLRPGDVDRSGPAASVAIGRDLTSTGPVGLGPVLTLSGGRLGGRNYRALGLGVSATVW